MVQGQQLRISVGAHHVEYVVVPLSGERNLGKRMPVVGIRDAFQRNVVVDHPPRGRKPGGRWYLVICFST